jgi:hypothetical protein
MVGGYIGLVEELRARSEVSPYPAAPPEHEGFVLGLAFGLRHDFVAVIEKFTVTTSEVRQPGFEMPQQVDTALRLRLVRLMQRLDKLGYPELIALIAALLKALPRARMAPALVVDATSTGAPPIAMMRKAGLRPIAVTIFAGHDEIRVASDDWKIPRRALVSTLSVLAQSARLRVSPGLAESESFITGLSNFRSTAGSDAAWRDSIGESPVTSVAVAAWLAERPALATNFKFDLSR